MFDRDELAEIEHQRSAAVETAQAIIDGRLGVLEGAYRMLPFRWTTGVDEFDEDFLTFVSIESQNDHLPIGPDRQHWSVEALAEKDAEIMEAEAFHRDDAFRACRSIISRFQRV